MDKSVQISLYEIGKQTVKEDYIIIILAKIGGGKGKISRHFILRGLNKILHKYQVDIELKEMGITPEIEKELKHMVNIC